jgi:CHAT domain-containing protein
VLALAAVASGGALRAQAEPTRREPEAIGAAASIDALEPFVERLERQRAQVGGDPRAAAAHFETGRLVLRRLQVLLGEGKAPHAEPSQRLFDRVVAATAVDAAADRGWLALQIASLRSVLGAWREAIAELQPWTKHAQHGMRALDQIAQICLQHRCIVEGWPAVEEAQRHLDAADPLTRATWLRHRAALSTIAGVLDHAAEAMASFRSLPAVREVPRERADDNRWKESRTSLLALAASTELDVLLATERYDEALAAAVPLSGRAGQSGERGRLGVAIAHLRRGDDAAARPVLEALAPSGSAYGRRAVAELALLELRTDDRAAARALLDGVRARPLEQAAEDELNALAWVTLADLAAGAPPFVEPALLRGELRALLATHLAQWEAIPPSASGVAFLQLPVRRDLLAALCALLLHEDPTARGVEACLDHVLAAEARGSTARTLRLPVRRFAEVRDRVVPANGALVVHLPAVTASFAFVVTADGARSVRLAGDVGLRRDVRRLREAIGTPDTAVADVARAGAAVAGWGMPPALRAALERCDEVAFVGRELATGLPFEALPWDGTWLGCAKAVWSVPSMTLQAAAAQRPAVARALGVAVLAATAIDAEEAARHGVTAIPVRGDELAAVAAAVAPAATAVVAPASSADLLAGPGARAAVAVVFAHGITDPDRARPFGVLLGRYPGGDTGAVFADDVVAAADVVLLGSCQLGRGTARRGEDGGHRIAGAFLQAGARAVVLGDGDLGLAPTLALARAFLRELTAGATVGVALQRARREVAATPGWEHPWFHGQLRLEGNGGLRVALDPAPPAGSRWPWLLVAAAAAGFAIVARARRRTARAAARADC